MRAQYTRKPQQTPNANRTTETSNSTFFNKNKHNSTNITLANITKPSGENTMATQPPQKRTPFRWATSKGLIAITLFTLLAILIEYLIILYAISLGTVDPALITLTWPTTMIISSLFHVIPITVIITLVASWTYLTKKLAARPLEQKATPRPQKHPKAPPTAKTEQKPKQPLTQRIRQAKKPIKTTLIITLLFLLFTLTATVLAYPQLIYSTIASGYQNNPSLTNFAASVNNAIQGFNHATGPLGGIATAINDGIRILSPGIRAAGTALGNALTPIARLDPAGKYLAIQNIAAWITVLAVIFYARYSRRPLRYRRK